MFQTILRF